MNKTTLLKRAELRKMFHETESSRAPSAYIGYMKTAADAVMDLLDDLEAAEARVRGLDWQDISDEGWRHKAVLVKYKMENGGTRKAYAEYAEKFTLPMSENSHEDDGEWNENEGQRYAPEGWYEFGWEAEETRLLGGDPTHWKLP